MSWLYDNLAALTVALVSAVLAWLCGGIRGDLLTPVAPWMLLFLLEMLVFFPQRRGGETSFDARKRLWKDLRRDPLVWVSAGLVLLLIVPFVNTGLCPSCDARLIADGMPRAPKLPILPFCVDRLDHLNVFWWFSITVLALLTVHHSLARRGKRLVIAAIVWNAVPVAILGFLQAALNAPGPYWTTTCTSCWGTSTFFSTFGYPNMAGSYFALMFGLSVALWRDRRDRLSEAERSRDISATAPKRPRMFWKRNVYLIPTAICFYAAISTLSRAAILMVVVSGSIYAYHSFVSYLAGRHRAERLRKAVVLLAGFVAMVAVAIYYLPKDVQKEVDSINTAKVLDRVSGRGDRGSAVACKLWLKHRLFGCGGWGYRHLSRELMDKEYASTVHISPGSMNVHNDYLQFLTEHGLIGFGLLVAAAVLLLVPVGRIWRQLARSAEFAKDAAMPRPRQLFALPAAAFTILVACGCPLVHAFGDCPLRSPAVLVDLFIAFAALPGFLPKLEAESKRHHHHHHHHHHH